MERFGNSKHLSRRQVLAAGAAGVCVAQANALEPAQEARLSTGLQAYENHAKGIRIFPGAWRPHYPWEHIAWVSPSWPSQDYIWLDFPEAIFTRQGLLFLSAVNPAIQPMMFSDLPAVPWRPEADGIAYERTLPNGVVFGGKVTKAEKAVNLELSIRNGSDKPLNDIRLQTCFFLRAIREFGAYTDENKYVHVPGQGWLAFEKARKLESVKGRYRLGWRGGPQLADLPMMVTVSSKAERLVACTWLADTYSLINNRLHPCMHSDPAFPDLPAGKSATIHGKLLFFEGNLVAFDEALRAGRLGVRLGQGS